MSALAVPQTEPIDHGRELLALIGAEATVLPTALAEELMAIEAIQDESAAAIQTAAKRPIAQIDQIKRDENDQLTDRALESALPADLPLVDALAMVTAIQTRHALTRTTTDPNKFEAVDGNLFRHDGEDVYHPGEMYLPLVEGQHVSEGLKLLINELDAEFQSSDLEAAIIKACMYLNLAMLLHPQKDFNSRVLQSFFDYLLARTQPDKKSIRVFRNAHADFKSRYLFQAREEIGAAIFAKHFPELAKNPLFARFIKILLRKLFTHTRNMGEVLAELPVGESDIDGLFRNSWSVYEAEGVEKKNAEEALAAMEATGTVDVDDIFTKLKALEKFDSQAGYFKAALEASKVITAQLIREVAPVLKVMRRSGSAFTYYYFSEAYKKLNGDNRPDPNIRSSIELVLWAMDQLRIH